MLITVNKAGEKIGNYWNRLSEVGTELQNRYAAQLVQQQHDVFNSVTSQKSFNSTTQKPSTPKPQKPIKMVIWKNC